MKTLLKGAPVAEKIIQQAKERADKLKENGIIPTLAAIRVGERDGDISYERGAEKRCAAAGVDFRKVILPADTDTDEYLRQIRELNENPGVHGILMFLPLPDGLDENRIRREMRFEKDVDGCTAGSAAGVFTGKKEGFPPCTAQAAMEILDYYGIACEGKKAVVAGRSLVVGRPAAMMLLQRNATVTVCHSRTADLAGEIRQADIAVIAIGKMESLGGECFREGQTVIDVGIHWNEEKNKLCGDIRFEEAEPVVDAVTPVPGGVGAVTSSILALHTVEAAERMTEDRKE